MMEEQVQYTLEVEGHGDSKEAAYSKALASIQAKVIKEKKSAVLRIEPLHIEVMEALEQVSVEYFLFFFFKREVKKYYLKLNVTVALYLFHTDKIAFQSVKKPAGLGTLRRKLFARSN